MSVKMESWIQMTFYKRECVKFLPASRDHHRCFPVCHVCQNLVRCCCGRLIGEHSELDSSSWLPPSGEEEVWCVVQHTKTSPTDAFGSIDFPGSNKCSCRAKYVRLSCDAKPEELLSLMLQEWKMAQPKLLISVHGGTDNFPLPPRVGQAFSKGLIRAAETAGAWIFTDGFNTGVSMYVGDAVKVYGTHERRKRSVIGITPWGLIENHTDLLGRDVLRHYQTLGNPLSKRSSLNNLHSHFLLVDDGTLGKSGSQQELRRKLERHIQRQRIHPRLGQRVPLVCVVVEGGPAVLSTVLEYVSRSPPVPVIVFEGTGRAADLLSLIHKQTAVDRELDVNIKEDFLQRIEDVFGVARTKAHQLFTLLKHCMEHREVITIYDSESEDHLEADVAILTASLRGTPAEKLSVTLAWDRADIAQQHVLVYGHHWKMGALEHTMLNALLMDRVSFVKLLIENGVTMKHFLTVSRLEELYNMRHQGSSDHFLRHIIEDAKQCRLPRRYKISLIDIGMVIEYLIGGAYRSTYRSKSFKAVYNRIHSKRKEGSEDRSLSRRTGAETSETNQQQSQFYRTANPYRRKMESESVPNKVETVEAELSGSSLFVYSFNDLFVWAVLKRRQQLALFLWQHGVQAMARAVVACRLYQAMASEAKESNMDDSITDELKKYSLEFGQLAVDLLDKAFKENERMAMKLLTWEMTDWSNFTCLQMAVASGHRPFVTHSCTQMLLTDLWMGRLNMRKNSWLKIIVSILLPVGIQLLEFKSEAEMSHVPQTQEALQFGRDTGNLGGPRTENVMQANESDAERGRSRGKHKPSLIAWWLPWSRKVYDFYNAPVVKFWVHTMSYLTFLALFSYTVLVRMEPRPSIPEWLVFAYISSTAVDKISEVLASEPRRFSKKLKMWFSEYWNMNDFVAIILFFVGMALRWYTGLTHITGRIIYCLDIILWFVRLLDLLAINQQAGPYLTMISNMMKNMLYIVVIMGIVLVSFGTPRWAILNPHEEPSWNLLKQVLFQPYFMMFGEVYAGEINPCEEDPDCPPGSFLNPLLQAVYLFMQYIIMVNLLIAFYNNVYIDMKTISNQLWRYNRYRYIMTYHKKPFLPPPLIFLSHMALCVNAVWQKHRRTSTHDRDTGLKLFLAPNDLKKLLEFEERCVAGYFRDKHESQHCSQINRIRHAADKAEEMMGTLAEVSEKVQFIQENLQTLDAHLGRLQDLSALAVDTLNLLSASENRQQEAVHLCTSPRITVTSYSQRSSIGVNLSPSYAPLSPKAYWSNPPSLLRGSAHGKSCNTSELASGHTNSFFDSKLKWVLGNLEAEHSGPRRRLGGDSSIGFRLSHGSLSNLLWDQHGSPGQSCTSSLTTVWDHEPQIPPSQEESMEEEDDEDDDVFIETRATRNSVLGIVNPAFCGDSELAMPKQGHFGRKLPFAIERELGHSRSLSASVETLAIPTKRHSVSGEPLPLHPGQKNRDPYRILERKRSFGRKCVKIKEGEATDVRRLERDLTRRSRRKGKRMAGHKFRSSVSLSQLTFDHVDFLQKSLSLSQNTRSPSQSVWNSWTRSVSRRSSVQSWVAVEPRASVFKSTEDLDPHYSAMERNNLMRLAHTIPFTPVSMLGGEEVYVYTLEESDPDSMLSSTSSWCQRGHAAVLQPVSEQGVLDGGLRSAQWVLCTWAEEDVLKPGCVYVVKSFHEEVVHTWQTRFPNSTTFHLCLREIQQQRAAQKLMQVFNQVKPSSVPQSFRFVDLSLVYWQAKGQWLTIERSMNGDFKKYNSTTGEEITPSCGLEETVLSFSHWTYEYTDRELLVLDLQGVGVELTEPSVIRAVDKSSSRDSAFGATKLSDDAVWNFVRNHTCNSSCRKLGLTDLRKSSNLHIPASEYCVSSV